MQPCHCRVLLVCQKNDFDAFFASEVFVFMGQVLLAILCCQCEKPRRVQKLISTPFLQVRFLCFWGRFCLQICAVNANFGRLPKIDFDMLFASEALCLRGRFCLHIFDVVTFMRSYGFYAAVWSMFFLCFFVSFPSFLSLVSSSAFCFLCFSLLFLFVSVSFPFSSLLLRGWGEGGGTEE